MLACRAFVVLLLLSTPALCQTPDPVTSGTISLSGPRFGLTVLSDGVVAKLRESSRTLNSPVSQFGWQFEKIFFNPVEPGPTIVSEWVVLAGGLDQGQVIPSLTWLVGLRTMAGTEFGLGPNITPAGAALAIAAGRSFQAGPLHIPINLAVVPSKSGVRVSLLTGFNRRKP
jgi:hypothetical protein